MFDTPPGFTQFVPAWETLFLNLRQTPPETLTAFTNAIGWAYRALQAEKAPYEEIEQTLREAMAGLEGLSEEQQGQWLRVAWYLLLLVTHRRGASERPGLVELLQEQARQSKFREREEWRNMEMNYAELLHEEGRIEGRVEGSQTSLRLALETVLTARFGILPEAIAQAIAAADHDTLNDWLRKGATAETLDAVGISSPA